MRHRGRQVDRAGGDGLCPPALRHLLTLEVRRQAEVVAPPPENVVLDRAGRIGGDMECCDELPACPPVLGYARARGVADADLGSPEGGVRDDVDKRGGRQPSAAA
jgi:hypothetical protein